MFLRFYDQTDENIDKCINKMKPNLKSLEKVIKEPISLSVNPFLPKETDGKNIQVTLVFDTSENELLAFQNKSNAVIYKKYCTRIKGAEVTFRQPSDNVFKVI